MKKWIITGLALPALFAAAPESRAYTNYPWCVHGDSRGMECVFTSKEQCAQDGRNRGFGGQCVPNPWYNPKLGTVVEEGSAKKPARQRKPER